MRERWVIYQADQYEEEWVRYQGKSNEERGVSPKSLPDDEEDSYDSYTHGSAAVEVFINAHAVEMPNPLVRIGELEAKVERLTAALRRTGALANGIIERNQGGYVGDKNDVREIVAITRAALVAGKETT